MRVLERTCARWYSSKSVRTRATATYSGGGGLLGLESRLLRLPAMLERGGEDAVEAMEVPPSPSTGARRKRAPRMRACSLCRLSTDGWREELPASSSLRRLRVGLPSSPPRPLIPSRPLFPTAAAEPP